jgi:hypothetical protein
MDLAEPITETQRVQIELIGWSFDEPSATPLDVVVDSTAMALAAQLEEPSDDQAALFAIVGITDTVLFDDLAEELRQVIDATCTVWRAKQEARA